MTEATTIMSFHQRHCAEDGDCPLRATTCEVKNFPDGHERRGCRIEEFAAGPEGGYKVHLMNEQSLAIARAIVNRTTDPPCPGDCDVCNKLGCSERREEPTWIE